MTSYLPYIFGFCSLIGGIYLLLYSFQLYKPKHKTEEQKKRYARAIEKFGTLMKVCSIMLIINGSYDLIKRDASRYKIDKNTDAEWASNDRENLIKNCMKGAGANAKNYPEITQEYCECSIDKIMTAMTKDQYGKSLSKSEEEQIKEILPIVQNCLTELNQRIEKERETKANNI